MRLVLQRVRQASVTVAGAREAEIGTGIFALVGVARDDGPADADRAAAKVATLRLFADDAGKMNLALGDVGGAVLAVSQFTLVGSIAKGRRPGFDGAMAPEPAAALFTRFVTALRGAGIRVETGVFGARMQVALINDGPVTFVYETGS